MKYPAKFEALEGGKFLVTFRDIPEAITQGDDENDAIYMGGDALLTALEFYFEDRRPVPMPSELQEGERYLTLPLSITAKILLLNEMLAQRIRPSDLSRLMNIRSQEITRIVSIKYATKIDTMQAAFTALGKELELVAR